MSISAALRQAGHQTAVAILGWSDNPLPSVRRHKPDLLAFPCNTPMATGQLQRAKLLKQATGLPTVFGGIHPTLCPELIQRTEVDFLCRGEGEAPMVELVTALENGQPAVGIANIWARQGDQIHRNQLRPLVEDLDSLEDPDRDLYYRQYPALKRAHAKEFFIGRGCPFGCTFCSNAALHTIQGSAKVRRRSPARVIAEIKEVRRSYGLHYIYFNDDIFVWDFAWLEQFLDGYRREIGLPFTCASRASLLSEASVNLLAAAGCRCVEIGVETGNETLRKSLLGKEESNKALLAAARRVKQAGMSLKTSNMMALPGETPSDAASTIRLNAAMGVSYANCSLFQPYPGLALTDHAQALHQSPQIENVWPEFSFADSPLDLPNKDQLVNLQRLFSLGLRWPAAINVLMALSKLPRNPIFDAFHVLAVARNYRGYHHTDLPTLIELLWHTARTRIGNRQLGN